MKSQNPLVLFLILSVLAAGGIYYEYRSHGIESETPAKAMSAMPSPIPQSTSTPEPHYAVAAPNASGQNIPSLDQSDLPFEERLFTLFGKENVLNIFDLKELIRKIVVTVMNASEKNWQLDTLPFKVVPGAFTPEQKKNDKRYAPYLNLVSHADLKQCANLYVQFYPLFQAAYHEIEAKGDFNDVVVKVIDTLLLTPDPKAAPELIRLSLSFKYADPELEALSVSQKILIRVGPYSEKMLKERLRELRTLLTHLNP